MGWMDIHGIWHNDPPYTTDIGMSCPNCGKAVSTLIIVNGATYCGYCKPNYPVEAEIEDLKRRIEKLERDKAYGKS